MTPEIYTIIKRRQENQDTFSIWLRPSSVQSEIVPGQFNMIYVFGVGEVPISISKIEYAKNKVNTLVHTIRAVGAVTTALGKLKIGETIGLRGPFGTFWPTEKGYGKDVMLIAGGIGLAPLRPVLHSIAACRDRYKKVIVLYGARSPKDILFEKELNKLQSDFGFEVEITVDHADSGWKGNVGVVPNLISKKKFDAQNVKIMMCGPEIMMHFVINQAQKLGVSDDSIYLSMERNMKCAVGFCGHCQFMPFFMCKNGPVFRLDEIRPFFGKKEV